MDAFEYLLRRPIIQAQEAAEESSEELTVEDIIEHKPKTKIVREFFRDNLAGIRSEEEKLFSKN